jgi:hypothetical protein
MNHFYLKIPIQLSEDMLSEFVIGLEIARFVLSDQLVKVGINGNIVLTQLISEAVNVNGTSSIILDGFSHLFLKCVL